MTTIFQYILNTVKALADKVSVNPCRKSEYALKGRTDKAFDELKARMPWLFAEEGYRIDISLYHRCKYVNTSILKYFYTSIEKYRNFSNLGNSAIPYYIIRQRKFRDVCGKKFSNRYELECPALEDSAKRKYINTKICQYGNI